MVCTAVGGGGEGIKEGEEVGVRGEEEVGVRARRRILVYESSKVDNSR